MTQTIFIELLDEGVAVWRPVQAIHLEKNAYKVIDQAYDRKTESWQCGSGDRVICDLVDSSDHQILAAIALAP